MALSLAPRLITPRTIGAIASLALMNSAPAFAAGTDAQREACTPDAFRLCSMAMPDETRVESCLRAAGPRLSRACHDVFFPPEAAASNQITRGQAPAPRDRMQPSAPMRPQNPSMPQMPPGPELDD
ncbi:hypothetical protein [Tardiphaga sp.]|jgi:hypothetical protein|uniref:hypothetical protein n=1 Tax=Tardiphaga sp. TaxID=1926292 RepID=UPI0037DA13F9